MRRCITRLPNIWKPIFPLSYALALVVLARAARAGHRSWLSMITLAALIGFLGLLSTSLAPIVFVLWAGLEAVWLFQSRRAGSAWRSDLIRSASGLALAAMLLLAGSFSYLVPGGSVPLGMSLGGNEYVEGRRLLGTFERLPGGIGILGLGPLAVAVAAVLLARRDRLVLALAAGTGLLLLASLLLNYEPKPRDIVRLEGHARNFALFALLVALGVRLAGLRSARWRHAAGALLVGLIVWPTIVAPVRNLGLAVGNGSIWQMPSERGIRLLRGSYSNPSRLTLSRSTFATIRWPTHACLLAPYPRSNDFRHGPPQRVRDLPGSSISP